MITERLEQAFNSQINREFYSAYLYLSMSAYFDSQNLEGLARWMRVQAKEELSHAMKLYDYLVQRVGRVVLASIETPPPDWLSPLDAFERAFEHERKVTGLIHDLVILSTEEGDQASISFLKWFVDEQVEEEASANSVVAKLRLIGDNSAALFTLDRDLGRRGSPQSG